jgi:hypothetical protein
MSTITGLISAGGAGGGATNIVTDINLLTRVIVQQSLTDLRYGTTLYNPGESSYYSNPFNYNYTYQAEATTADTYVTLADITSSSNGGYLHCLVTPATIDTESTTIKFTVDGTATEITYANGSGSSTHVVGIFGGTIPNPQTTTNESHFNTANLGHQAGTIWTREDTTNKWYAGSQNNLICQPWLSQALNLPRLRFESTLKIEIKKSAIGAVVEDNKASAFITLQ